MSRARSTRVVAIIAALAVVAGLGIYVNHRLRAPATDHAVELVPADVRVYLHVFLKPSTSQRRALRDLLERFPQTDEGDEAKTFVSDLLRDALGRFGVDVGEDAGEWLGDEAAVYLPGASDEPVVLLELEDAEEGLSEIGDALSDRNDGLVVEHVDGFALVGHASVIGTPDADESLASSGPYRAVVDELEEHRIALAYVKGAEGEPAAAVLYVTPDTITLDANTPGPATTFRSLRGFVVADLTGVRGAFSLNLPTPEVARGVERIVTRTVDLYLSREGRSVLATFGGAVVPEPPAELVSAARRRLGEGFDPTFVVDASVVPPAVRRPFLLSVPQEVRPLLEEFLTLEFGVRDHASGAFARLVISFASA